MTFLKKLFGPSKKEVWSEVAQEIDAYYYHGGFFGRSEFIYEYKSWKIYLDTVNKGSGKNQQVYTRLRAPFYNPSSLTFKIYEEGLFSLVRKKLGMQDIEMNERKFDDRFIIKGSDDFQVQRILNDAELMNLMFALPRLYLFIDDGKSWMGKSYPEGVSVLSFEEFGVIKDKLVLKSIFRMFEMLLDRMVKIGMSTTDAPQMMLR